MTKYINNIDEFYTLGNKLGSGQFVIGWFSSIFSTASVYHATKKNGTGNFAIKVVEKERQRLVARDSYYRDIYNVLPSLTESNNASIYEVFESEKHFYIVMERCAGPDLVEYVLSFEPGAISESICKSIIFQILSGVNTLHKNRMLHRDVKLDNLMFRQKPIMPKKQSSGSSNSNSDQSVSEGDPNAEVVLLDYDMCMFLDRADPPKNPEREGEVSVVGTKEYMPPECYKGLYSMKSDVWSCGVVLYVLLDGHFPFDISNCPNSRDSRKVLKSGARPERFHRHLARKSVMAAELVSSMLVYEPASRCESAYHALMSPWFSPIARPLSSNNNVVANLKDTNLMTPTNNSNSHTHPIHPSNPSSDGGYAALKFAKPSPLQLQQQHLAHHDFISNVNNFHSPTSMTFPGSPTAFANNASGNTFNPLQQHLAGIQARAPSASLVSSSATFSMNGCNGLRSPMSPTLSPFSVGGNFVDCGPPTFTPTGSNMGGGVASSSNGRFSLTDYASKINPLVLPTSEATAMVNGLLPMASSPNGAASGMNNTFLCPFSSSLGGANVGNLIPTSVVDLLSSSSKSVYLENRSGSVSTATSSANAAANAVNSNGKSTSLSHITQQHEQQYHNHQQRTTSGLTASSPLGRIINLEASLMAAAAGHDLHHINSSHQGLYNGNSLFGPNWNTNSALNNINGISNVTNNSSLSSSMTNKHFNNMSNQNNNYYSSSSNNHISNNKWTSMTNSDGNLMMNGAISQSDATTSAISSINSPYSSISSNTNMNNIVMMLMKQQENNQRLDNNSDPNSLMNSSSCLQNPSSVGHSYIPANVSTMASQPIKHFPYQQSRTMINQKPQFQ